MAQQTRKIHTTDTRTKLSVELKQPNISGVDTVVDLTGLTVEFKMVDGDGATVVTKTATGITVTDATNGLVEYDFQSAGVATPGMYYGYFVVTDTGETDHFPVCTGDLRIEIEADA